MLTDSFGRTIRYLRVSVTDRCNLYCTYCRLTTEKIVPNHKNTLTSEEIIRLVRLFVELGVERIRLTGGEPLLRRNIVGLVRELAAIPGLQELSLSTNALLLERYAIPLREAGLQRVNISLDSLDPDTFSQLTKAGNSLPAVLAGIKAAARAGLYPIKVNMVVMRGVNAHEIPAMVLFAKEQGLVLRFIETMPIGEAGLNVSQHFMPAEEILESIRTHLGALLTPVQPSSQRVQQGAGPARYFLVSKTGAEVGIISARSQHFCDSCNRMRLTSQGALVYCLGQEDQMDLKTPLRQGASDEQLKTYIRQAVDLKPERHGFEQLDALDKTFPMSELGG